MAEEAADTPQRWTAKRQATLALNVADVLESFVVGHAEEHLAPVQSAVRG